MKIEERIKEFINSYPCKCVLDSKIIDNDVKVICHSILLADGRVATFRYFILCDKMITLDTELCNMLGSGNDNLEKGLMFYKDKKDWCLNYKNVDVEFTKSFLESTISFIEKRFDDLIGQVFNDYEVSDFDVSFFKGVLVLTITLDSKDDSYKEFLFLDRVNCLNDKKTYYMGLIQYLCCKGLNVA